MIILPFVSAELERPRPGVKASGLVGSDEDKGEEAIYRADLP